MKHYLKKYWLLVILLGSLLTGVQLFGSAFFLLWVMNEVRVGITVGLLLACAWIFSKL